MTRPTRSTTPADPLDLLRRRMYRPDATDEDRQRYLEQRDSAVPAAEQSAPPAAPSARRDRRVAVIGLAAGVAAVLVTGVALSTWQNEPKSAAGGGAEAVQAESDRALTPYGTFVPTPTPLPVEVDGMAAVGQQYRGRGGSRFPIDVGSASFDGGAVVVAVTTDGPGPVSWTATRIVPGRTSTEQVVASSSGSTGQGVAAPERFAYDGAPPVLLAVRADPDARWVLTVVLLDAAGRPVG